MHHDLKTWPQFYERVITGEKNFELRTNDRVYQAGDTVILKEYDPLPIEQNASAPGEANLPSRGYTGRVMNFRIGYVMPLADGQTVVFSLLPLEIK